MKRLFTFGLLVTSLMGLLAVGCNKDSSPGMADKLDALEKRIAELEKRPAFPQRPPAPPAQATAYVLPIGQSHVLGNKEAPVTITVFSDFQCPFCAKIDPILEQAMKDPELKDKINVVFKHFPLSFHKEAKPASKAALAAGEQGSDKFWKMSEAIFKNQASLTTDNFTKWAKEIGLNVPKFTKDLKDNDAKYEEVIKADTELGIKVANVRGTPSLFVGGWELRERSVDGVKNVIREKKLISLN